MGIIALEGMKFRAHHGVHAHEKTMGNDFEIDLYIKLDYERAAMSDNIHHTIDYEEYYRIVCEVMQRQQYNLLEHINYQIIEAIHDKFKTVEWIKVQTRKLHPPVGGEVRWVAAIDQREF